MLILNALCTKPGCNKPADYAFRLDITNRFGFSLEKDCKLPVGYTEDIYACFKHATYVMESPKFIENFDVTFNIRLFRNFWSLLDHYSNHD